MNSNRQLATCFFLCLFAVTVVKAQLSPTVKMQLRSNLSFPGQTCANICGYAANGKEYALVGNQTGTGIVDVTNPTNPVLLKQVIGTSNIWREIKVYRNYAYVTTEASGQGLQIIDLTKLSLPIPDVDVKSFKGPEGDLVLISRIHALHIDTTKGFLYAYGGSSTVKVSGVNTTVTGAVVLDIKTDPWNPRYVGKYSSKYVHDGFVINDTLYAAHINDGYFSIIDFTNKTSPVVLGTKATPTTFTHNTWRSDDGKTIFTTDENNGSYLASYDVTTPSNIKLLDKIRSPSGANAIVHNTHVLNDFLVTSWYTEGVIVVDAHRPQNLVLVGQYDTYNGTSADLEDGAWGVYPYLPSGNLIVSNFTSGQGLFVLTPQYVRACYLEGVVTSQTTGLVLSGVSVTIASTDMDKKAVTANTGFYYTGQVTAGTFSVTYAKTGYVTKTITGVVLANGVVTIQDVALVPVSIPVELVDIKAKKKENSVQVTWQTASEVKMKSFDVERSTAEAPNEFVKLGEVKAVGRANTYIFEDELSLKTKAYYYRLKMNPENIGDTKSEYSKIVSVVFDDNAPVKVTPSVSMGLLTVENGESIEVINSFGQLVFSKKLNSPLENINLSFLPSGLYFANIENRHILFSNKFVIKK